MRLKPDEFITQKEIDEITKIVTNNKNSSLHELELSSNNDKSFSKKDYDISFAESLKDLEATINDIEHENKA